MFFRWSCETEAPVHLFLLHWLLTGKQGCCTSAPAAAGVGRLLLEQEIPQSLLQMYRGDNFLIVGSQERLLCTQISPNSYVGTGDSRKLKHIQSEGGGIKHELICIYVAMPCKILHKFLKPPFYYLIINEHHICYRWDVHNVKLLWP